MPRRYVQPLLGILVLSLMAPFAADGPDWIRAAAVAGEVVSTAALLDLGVLYAKAARLGRTLATPTIVWLLVAGTLANDFIISVWIVDRFTAHEELQPIPSVFALGVTAITLSWTLLFVRRLDEVLATPPSNAIR